MFHAFGALNTIYVESYRDDLRRATNRACSLSNRDDTQCVVMLGMP